MNAPFQYGTLATRENFVDRVEDRAQLKNFLSSHINVMLVSPRRWGKSVLVKVTMEELQDEKQGMMHFYYDMPGRMEHNIRGTHLAHWPHPVLRDAQR